MARSRKPLISIIIPAYNSSKFIGKTLNSILKFPLDCEIVVVDDGSTDDTLQILSEYKINHDIISVFHKRNGGVSSARNMGIEKSKGKYVLFLDADDVITENILYLEGILRRQEVDIMKFDYKAQRFLKMWYKNKVSLEGVNEGFVDINKLRINVLKTTKFNSVCFQVVNSRIVKKIRFNEKYIMAEDLDFNLKLYDKAKRVYYFPKPIIKYMYNNGSATRSVSTDKCKKQYSDMLDVYGKLYSYRDKWGVDISDFEIYKHVENVFATFRKDTGFLEDKR